MTSHRPQAPGDRAPTKPEILAPAGDRESLMAALEAGADAVYFGLDEGFNARARAANFSLSNLDQIAAEIRAKGARSYLTLNTLIFESELDRLQEVLTQVARSGIDALILQDPAVAIIAKGICPELELHASTQMTISSPEASRFSDELGITRVVVPRELSVDEIHLFAQATDVELEVFIHGALCVSWSGQCLTSEAWGGRSANRGQCAQACRLPYDLIIDGKRRPLGDVRYLLSPQDLAGMRAVDPLRGWVHGLKIEGRQKGPHYVRTAVQGYRRLVDSLAKESSTAQKDAQQDLLDMSLAYSRGFTDGFLAGSDHQTLVEGRFPKHRGVYLGRIREIEPDGIVVEEEQHQRPWTGGMAAPGHREGPKGVVSSPLEGFGGHSERAAGPTLPPLKLEAGMGVVIDTSHPEEEEPGGPVFRVESRKEGLFLGLARETCDLRLIKPGDRVWVTRAKSRDGRVRNTEARRGQSPKQSLDISVIGSPDQPLCLVGRAGGKQAEVSGDVQATKAQRRGLDQELLQEKLGALGETPFVLDRLDLQRLGSNLHVPVSELKRLRRKLVEILEAETETGPSTPRQTISSFDREAITRASPLSIESPEFMVLCRNDEQLDAVIECGLEQVALDWMEMVGLGQAVERARSAGLKVILATVRVQKPGEEVYDNRLEKLKPDGVLIRHFGGLMWFRDRVREGAWDPPTLIGDFSLNVTNSITAHHLINMGLDRVTASHDLDQNQLRHLMESFPPSRLSVVVHHHISAFHTEHCVYSHLLSQGRDYRTCGRPCEKHQVSLRDQSKLDHPVIVDVECRNTVFNAKAQSAASLVPELTRRPVGEIRIEFVRESREQAADIIRAYQKLMRGTLSPKGLLSRVGVHEQFGVTSGTMETLS